MILNSKFIYYQIQKNWLGIFLALSTIFYIKGLTSKIFYQPVFILSIFVFIYFTFYLFKIYRINKKYIFYISLTFILFISMLFQIANGITYTNGIVNELGRIIFPFLLAISIFFILERNNELWNIFLNILIIMLLIDTLYRIFETGIYFPSLTNRYLIKTHGILFIDPNFTGYIAGTIFLLLAKFKNFRKVILKKIILLLVVFYSMSFAVWAGLFIVFLFAIIKRCFILKILSLFIIAIALLSLYNFVSNDGSFLTKIQILQLSYNFFTTESFVKVLIGIGHGNFASYFAETNHGAHNLIGISVEGGLLFLLVNIIFYFYLWINNENKLAIIFILSAGLVSMYPIAYMSPIYVLLFYNNTKRRFV